MAGGGLPVPFEESARVTVLAALEMAEFIKKRSQDQLRAGKISFEMRAGVHTGPVVAGIVGAKKFQYDVWGDTVNTASRMESSGEAGKVNISKATYVKIKEDPQFRFLQRGRIEAKGKGFIPMYFVESILPKAES
jgi:class 3 adenylate cyclase